MKIIDNSFVESAEGLLENFWVFRDSDEELYLQIIDYEKDLREYFNEHFRFKLIVKPEFIKLEKVRESHQQWMNVESFQTNRDFVMFYCLLAFLDDRVNQQFTLEDICGAIVSNYPEEHIIWTGAEGYRNRMSLIRVVRYACELKIMLMIDQDIEGFKSSSQHEVLFEGTSMIKYYIRNFSFSVQSIEIPDSTVNHNEGIRHIINDLHNLQNEEKQGIRTERKHHVYRRLFIEPVVYHNELNEDELEYIKHYNHLIRDHAERYTHMQFEQYRGNSLLVHEEEYVNASKKSYPEAKVISKITIQLGSILKKKIQNKSHDISKDGSLVFTNVEFRDLVQELKDETGSNWTKTYKDMSMNEFKKELLNYMLMWKLASITEDNDIIIHDVIARISGEFETNLIN